MTNYKTILALDPSGNFNEGKGTTGWCTFDCTNNKILDTGIISSNDYTCAEEYWDAHCRLINDFRMGHNKGTYGLVIEDYLLYASQASSQIQSRMETPKVIGIMQYFCWRQHIPYHMQPASEVKRRWCNSILLHKGIIKSRGSSFALPRAKTCLSRHTIDAIRHAVHYSTFKNRG